MPDKFTNIMNEFQTSQNMFQKQYTCMMQMYQYFYVLHMLNLCKELQDKVIENEIVCTYDAIGENIKDKEVTHGRMYDYNNGRFLSVDPFIQSPTSTQSMNPYTYIFNNPLSGVDPTGYRSSVGFGGRSVDKVCIDGNCLGSTFPSYQKGETKKVPKDNGIQYSFNSEEDKDPSEQGDQKGTSESDGKNLISQNNCDILVCDENGLNIHNYQGGSVKHTQETTLKPIYEVANALTDPKEIVKDGIKGGVLGVILHKVLTIRKAIKANTSVQKLLRHLRIGHSIPYSEMNKAQRRAFQHSYSNHGKELGLPNWSDKNAENLRVQFNNVVGHIRETGIHLGTRNKPFNGKSTRVNYYISELNETRYYYYETMSGQFVSAGKDKLQF